MSNALEKEPHEIRKNEFIMYISHIVGFIAGYIMYIGSVSANAFAWIYGGPTIGLVGYAGLGLMILNFIGTFVYTLITWVRQINDRKVADELLKVRNALTKLNTQNLPNDGKRDRLRCFAHHLNAVHVDVLREADRIADLQVPRLRDAAHIYDSGEIRRVETADAGAAAADLYGDRINTGIRNDQAARGTQIIHTLERDRNAREDALNAGVLRGGNIRPDQEGQQQRDDRPKDLVVPDIGFLTFLHARPPGASASIWSGSSCADRCACSPTAARCGECPQRSRGSGGA